MSETILIVFAAVCFAAIIFLLSVLLKSVKRLKEGPTKRDRMRSIPKKPEDIFNFLADAILNFRKRDKDTEAAVYGKIPTVSRYHLSIKVDIMNFLERSFKQYRGSGFVVCYQKLFDQVLKMYAEGLETANKREQSFFKKYQSADEEKNRYSSKEIEKIFEEKEEVMRIQREAERSFWILHDTLKSLGFRTWGDKSYKVYLALRPSLDF